MRIKKMVKQGEKFYPVTITNAIKDINFLNENGKPMTQEEINIVFKSYEKKLSPLYLVYNTDSQKIYDINNNIVSFNTLYNYFINGLDIKVYIDELYNGALLLTNWAADDSIWFNNLDYNSNTVEYTYLIAWSDDSFDFLTLNLATSKNIETIQLDIDFYKLNIPIQEDNYYVDLELPSGLLWTSQNIGTSNTNPLGIRFTLGLSLIAINTVYGTDSEWRLPTLTEVNELIKNTTVKHRVVNGIPCTILKSKKNDNELILPYAGYQNNDLSPQYEGTYGYFWTSTSATSSMHNVLRSSNETNTITAERISSTVKASVRAVKKRNYSVNRYLDSNKIEYNGFSLKKHINNLDNILSEKPGKIVKDSSNNILGEVFNDLENNTATGLNSHAEGQDTAASGDYSHVGGFESNASGKASFAHGFSCLAKTNACTAFGWATIANRHQQTVIGQCNVEDTTDYTFIIGNGKDINDRHNALAVKDDGTIVTWINDEKIELSPSKIKELVEIENLFEVISSALNNLNTRLESLATTVTINQTLSPIIYGSSTNILDVSEAQTMDLGEDDYNELNTIQSLEDENTNDDFSTASSNINE